MSSEEMITIPLETLRHLFDLATDSPLVCSGNFDSSDVDVLRDIANLIGVDPESITPDEFITQYNHTFIPRPVIEVSMNVLRETILPGWPGYHRRETEEEMRKRIEEQKSDKTCWAGYSRKCGKLESDPDHQKRTP